jgi:hypothetical protein
MSATRTQKPGKAVREGGREGGRKGSRWRRGGGINFFVFIFAI